MYERIGALARVNQKAANQMVVQIAAGLHSGNNGMTAEGAARVAMETVEEILRLMPEADEAGGDQEDVMMMM